MLHLMQKLLETCSHFQHIENNFQNAKCQVLYSEYLKSERFVK